MSKKMQFLAGLILLPFLGTGLDILRDILVSWYSMTFSRIPYVLIFDAAASILFIGLVVWLSLQAQSRNFKKGPALLLILLGLFIVCIPLLRGTFLLPAAFLPSLFGSWQSYRTLAGAFWFILGLVKMRS